MRSIERNFFYSMLYFYPANPALQPLTNVAGNSAALINAVDNALLQQVSKALDAFYAATAQLQLTNQVTAFTLSDFGRTLQPSGTGSDHGWGNHHLILGGAVSGGKIYGTYPLMTNYANFNATNSDYSDNRGVMLPNNSLSQYGATLAKWFGGLDPTGLFPDLASFSIQDLGFMG